MAKNGTLAKSHDLQPSYQTTTEQITIGIDLGDRFSHCCVLGPDGKILTEGRLRSTPETMTRHFKDLPPSRIAIEVGTHSRWLSQLLAQWGHEVIVANPRNLRMIADSIRKSDQVDTPPDWLGDYCSAERFRQRKTRFDPKSHLRWP